MSSPDQQQTKTKSFIYLHKLLSAVILLAFAVIILGGLDAGARVITITYRTIIAAVGIGFVGRLVIRILVSYEETKGGKG